MLLINSVNLWRNRMRIWESSFRIMFHVYHSAYSFLPLMNGLKKKMNCVMIFFFFFLTLPFILYYFARDYHTMRLHGWTSANITGLWQCQAVNNTLLICGGHLTRGLARLLTVSGEQEIAPSDNHLQCYLAHDHGPCPQSDMAKLVLGTRLPATMQIEVTWSVTPLWLRTLAYVYYLPGFFFFPVDVISLQIDS